MSVGDFLLVAVRWLHLVSAAAWVGGSLFYLLVVRPAVRRASQTDGFLAAVATEYRALVNTCIAVLVVTGVILAFDRLTDGVVGAPYVITLGAKSALTVWMFLLVRSLRRRLAVLEPFREPRDPGAGRVGLIAGAMSGYNALIVIGIAVFFLSDLLKVLFELALTSVP